MDFKLPAFMTRPELCPRSIKDNFQAPTFSSTTLASMAAGRGGLAPGARLDLKVRPSGVTDAQPFIKQGAREVMPSAHLACFKHVARNVSRSRYPSSLSIPETDRGQQFNDNEMSQLTMSQATMENQDVMSLRSNHSPPIPPTTGTFPPLRQSSASSSATGSSGSMVLKAGLAQKMSDDMTQSQSVNSRWKNSNRFFSRGLQPRDPIVPLKRHPSEELSLHPTILQRASQTSRVEPTQPLLQVNSSRFESREPSQSLIQFRGGSARDSRILQIDSHSCMSQSVSQELIDENGSFGGSKQSFDKNSIESKTKKITEKYEKMLKNVHCELDSHVSNRMQKLQDLEKELEAKELAAIEDHEARVTKLMEKLETKEKDINARFSKQMDIQVSTLDRDLASRIEKLNRAAEEHLESLSKSTATSMAKIGKLVEAAKASIMSKSEDLVQAALPLIKDPVKTLAESFFVMLAKKQCSVQLGHEAVHADSINNQNCDTPDVRSTRKEEISAKECEKVSITQTNQNNLAASQDPKKWSVNTRRRSLRLAKAAPLEDVAHNDKEVSTVKRRVKGNDKKRSHCSKKKSKSKKLRIGKACVTPCDEKQREITSPGPRSVSLSEKQVEKKSESKKPRSQIPFEVLLSKCQVLSPLNNPCVDRKAFVSPVPFKKRTRSLKPRRVRSKRSRAYGVSLSTRRSLQDDAFDFLS